MKIPSELIPFSEILFRLVSAMICGLILGLDRELRGKSAGVKTLIAVSLAASLFTVLSLSLPGFRSGTEILDPGRIAAMVVLGVGFLCSGVVLQEGSDLNKVTGLTTAALIWVTAALGMACGLGYPLAAFVATFSLLFLLWIVTYIEEQIIRNFHSFQCDLVTENVALRLPERIRVLATQYDLKLTQLKIEPKDNHLRVNLKVRGKYRNGERFLKELSTLPTVKMFRTTEKMPSLPPSLRD